MFNLKLIDLPGDSGNYEVITDAANFVSANKTPGLAIEIGLRRGGGSKAMIDAMVANDYRRPLVGIDPYGNIDYNTSIGTVDNQVTTKMDYTNDMRADCMVNMYEYCKMHRVNFTFINLEDTEFFSRYADGVPIYDEHKEIWNQYALVHFDGPHFLPDVLKEIEFFDSRTPPDAAYVFDDVSYYKHEVVDNHLLATGWKNRLKTPHKWSYIKG
jgi:hypothetical protein